MRKFDITRGALKFVNDIDAKQFWQVSRKLLSRLTDPEPADSSKLAGYDYRRMDTGEYPIIYDFDDETTRVALVGKRNAYQVNMEISQKYANGGSTNWVQRVIVKCIYSF